MERIDFKQQYFIEGSQTPEEELSYWRLLRGEKVPVNQIINEGFYRIKVEGMLQRGEVVEEFVPRGRGYIVCVSLKNQ